MGFIIGVLYFLFIVSSLILIGIILLQEGKGGGFAEAFSGIGGETFGVRATGLHKFTGAVAAVFVVSALLVSILRTKSETVKPEMPRTPIGGQETPGTPPAGPGEQPPAGQNPEKPN